MRWPNVPSAAGPLPGPGPFRWRWSSKSSEEIVLRDGRLDRAAHPLKGFDAPCFRTQHLAELQKPAVLGNLGSMRTHGRELLVDEGSDVEPGRHPIVRHGERWRLAIGREAVLDPGPLHHLRHPPHHRLGKGAVVELARA